MTYRGLCSATLTRRRRTRLRHAAELGCGETQRAKCLRLAAYNGNDEYEERLKIRQRQALRVQP
jgi:hypothetical protein